MSATFACPHCGATYPVKPVLVGRAVRCTTCKNPFRLRPDGIADKVADEAPATAPAAASTAPAAASPAPAATPAPPSATAPAPRSAPASAPLPAVTTTPQPYAAARPAPAPEPGAARATRLSGQTQGADQREAQRKALAANLATAANAALAAESVKAETGKQKKTDRKTKAKGGGGDEGGVGQITAPVLTGYGEREHRNNLMWLFGAIGTVAAIILLFFLIGLKSPQRRALERFSAVVEGERSRYPERKLAIQERAWITGVEALTDLGSLHLGSTRAVPMGPLKPLFTETLKDLAYVPAHRLWAPADRIGEVDKLWNPKKDDAANIERLVAGKLRIVEQSAVMQQLQAAGWNDDDAALLMLLLGGHTNRTGENWIAKRLFAGEVPERIEICPFTGRDGDWLMDLGRTYRTKKVDYSGRLLRFIGQGWTDEWKVIEVKPAPRE